MVVRQHSASPASMQPLRGRSLHTCGSLVAACSRGVAGVAPPTLLVQVRDEPFGAERLPAQKPTRSESHRTDGNRRANQTHDPSSGVRFTTGVLFITAGPKN